MIFINNYSTYYEALQELMDIENSQKDRSIQLVDAEDWAQRPENESFYAPLMASMSIPQFTFEPMGSSIQGISHNTI